MSPYITVAIYSILSSNGYIFTTWRYASTAYAMALYLFVLLSIKSRCPVKCTEDSGESKPERTGTPFRGPAKSKKSVPGPQNVRIFTGTIASSPFRGPKHSPFLCQGPRSIHFL